MRKFTTLTVDSKTRMQMILSDCSYNQACYYLKGQDTGKLLNVRTVYIEPLTYKVTELRCEKATFIYDETRGFLMQRY